VPNYYFTESRLVPLYENENRSGRMVQLTPQAKVETDGNEDAYNLITMACVEVKVIDGRPFNADVKWWKEGSPPSGYILRKNLRKCLKKYAPEHKHRRKIYGGIVWRLQI
jgi:hypothetical protein